MKLHHYRTHIEWTGNTGEGTSGYTDYERSFTLSAYGKPYIAGSADPAFRGDASRWNPEEFLLASLSACHKLWYLHLCAVNGVIVLSYEDSAEAVMDETAGRFVSAILKPHVTISASADEEKARALHHDAHKACFIANSVSFPVACESEIIRV